MIVVVSFFFLCPAIALNMNNIVVDRRPIGRMPYRRRDQGMNPIELEEERTYLGTGITLLLYTIVTRQHPFAMVFFGVAAALIDCAASIRTMVYNILDPIDPQNRDRGIDSFTDEECWRYLRFRKRVSAFRMV